MALAIDRHGENRLVVLDDRTPVAEIAGTELFGVRFRPDAPPHITRDVPLPLGWRQYANHQDPDRNALQNPRIERCEEIDGQRVRVTVTAGNARRTILGRSTVDLIRHGSPVRYELEVRTGLRVVQGTWRVTPNPHHGEVEFCTLFPSGTFDPASPLKRYQSCVLASGDAAWRIPHHHLESADKHNIPMRRGDRLCWLLEDENPCLELLSDTPALAGLCAYMWDGHVAYSVCGDGRARELPAGTEFQAAYRILGLAREEAALLDSAATDRPAPDIDRIPLYVAGLNRFQLTGDQARTESWPWMHATDEGEAECLLDRTTGYDDSRSLRISGARAARARWLASTIGPAYGQPEFRDGARLRLTAMVRTEALEGSAAVALRLHRRGNPHLFDPASYELFRAAAPVSGDHAWTRLKILTPPISPAPDRVHILLEHQGRGTSWFDNVLLEETA